MLNMDLHQFLSMERKQLEEDRQRLFTARDSRKPNIKQTNTGCSAALLMQMESYVTEKRGTNTSNELAIELSLPLATGNHNGELQLDFGEHENQELPKSASTSTSTLKSAKKFVNQRELGSARRYKSLKSSYYHLESRTLSEGRTIGRYNEPVNWGSGWAEDDMEQWVTDTFYSYFPGFNNENQKRQNYLRERQRENQQNFLKHQILHPPSKKHIRQVKLVPSQTQSPEELQTARSIDSNTSTFNSKTDKTDLELIVNNNPDYVPPKTRPGTTRHQLLEDLSHVELSNIVSGDGIKQRNMRSAEMATTRKRDYQRDLMQQIEDKRRSIEILREKEQRQDEELTRRLEAQLKTMQLEEQLEKQCQLVEKARNESDHNRHKRERLLAKLEDDTQLLRAKENNNIGEAGSALQDKEELNEKDINCNSSNSYSETSKVYKYFSNSVRHVYRRGQQLPISVDLDFELPQVSKIELECLHLCEKICPLCDEPLKSYESCCLRCQRKLALKMKQHQQPNNEGQTIENLVDTVNEVDDHNCQNSYALVCIKCERLYAMCGECLVKSDVCRACQRKRNVCMNCRRNLCSFCLEEIACVKDFERSHISEQKTEQKHKPQQQQENAFCVLELNYNVGPQVQETTAQNLPNTPSPYSFNISYNSVFHPHHKTTPVKPFLVDDKLPIVSGSVKNSFDLNSADEDAMELVRHQTDQRLSRYLKNYGDLASKHPQLLRSKSESRDRGTQTTPQSLCRRDVVLHETPTQNLSIPLLREMPKMTRNETITMLTESSLQKIDNLKNRWEVPAVQKCPVFNSSPKVLTQVGAIRKQLQAARFFDDTDDNDEADTEDNY